MLSVVELVDDTLVAEMEVGELAVGVDEIREVHRAARPCRRAADLGDMEFEAVRQIDADTQRQCNGSRYHRPVATIHTGEIETPTGIPPKVPNARTKVVKQRHTPAKE